METLLILSVFFAVASIVIFTLVLLHSGDFVTALFIGVLPLALVIGFYFMYQIYSFVFGLLFLEFSGEVLP